MFFSVTLTFGGAAQCNELCACDVCTLTIEWLFNSMTMGKGDATAPTQTKKNRNDAMIRIQIVCLTMSELVWRSAHPIRRRTIFCPFELFGTNKKLIKRVSERRPIARWWCAHDTPLAFSAINDELQLISFFLNGSRSTFLCIFIVCSLTLSILCSRRFQCNTILSLDFEMSWGNFALSVSGSFDMTARSSHTGHLSPEKHFGAAKRTTPWRIECCECEGWKLANGWIKENILK